MSLFQPSKRIVSMLDALLAPVSRFSKVIALHARLGDHLMVSAAGDHVPGWQADRRYTMDCATCLLKQTVAKQNASHTHPTLLYATSDTPPALEAMRRAYPSLKRQDLQVVYSSNISGSIIHNDRLFLRGLTMAQFEISEARLWADWWMIWTADAVYGTYSGFSQTAALTSCTSDPGGMLDGRVNCSFCGGMSSLSSPKALSRASLFVPRLRVCTDASALH